ncbi:hypothetical protein EHQ12_12275 [Leptospira gomenensis]|uniref:Uncharacterized protein n=1 Tax=Leptospira gomenensis TaxID=2484974 RepID=A0A5F1Y9C3_9LEPT|nr:YfeK family protein [Leptospira gomenensis]TGK32710.1 hypothetical protein EHQ17_12120 [Leptospira gomenensis]TGK36857.1 hypothetical protein EHQ12_12275 [Leptospira gomenensis]TGK39933.1 hypothetical protein EHQ07_19575 [Leptospira gomenensis]TGK58068.1 hypothetical protein EHQ13_14475 [Leptospira gomenensis]
MMKKIFSVVTFLFYSVLFSVFSEDGSVFQNDLNSLMNSLEVCQCKFIRNGSEHDPKEAREHMERKLKAAEGRIGNISDFIEHIASKSSISGKPYLVRLKDGKTVEAKLWLTEKWKEISEAKNPSKKPEKRKK